MKRLLIELFAWYAAACALLVVAGEVVHTGIWHDALLLIGGLLLAATCVWIVLLHKHAKKLQKAKKEANDG